MSDLEIQKSPVAIDAPFFLIFGDVSSVFEPAPAFEDVIRRMGLRPKPVKQESKPHQHHFQIELGDLQAEISVHAPGDLTPSDALLLQSAEFVSAQHLENGALFSTAIEMDFLKNAPFVRLSPASQYAGNLGMRRIDMLRSLCQIAYQCCIVLHPTHVFWSPAQIWSDAGQFAEAVEDMFTTGLPPVAHMVAFIAPHSTDTPAETPQSLVSKGLALFCGQEILAAVPQNLNGVEIARRMKQLAADMMMNGPILEQRSVPGMHVGERIQLLPSLYGRNQEGVVRMTVQLG
jgi:hypothetical protein